MKACICVSMEQADGLSWNAEPFLSLCGELSEGVCIRPLPWRCRPRMRPTRAPSCLCPALPPPSSLQRWPSESLDRCRVVSAGPPAHRKRNVQCSDMEPVPTRCISDVKISSSSYVQIMRMNRTSLRLFTCRERAVLGGTLATSPCSFLFLNLRKYSWMRKVA